MTCRAQTQWGFTLIEMSIVLVIIGLIVGGILTGRDLIYTAQLNKLNSELTQQQVAINTFKLKYSCLPGDCSNGESFFGTNSSGCPIGGGTTGTCNGNGDGIINPWHLNGNAEDFYAVQQLSLAGLIGWSPNNANVHGGATGTCAVLGKNIPTLSWNGNIGYLILSFTNNAPGGYLPTGFTSGHTIIQIASLSGTNCDFLWGTGLTGLQSYDVDRKFDDGQPSSGIFQATSQNGSEAVGPNQNPYTTCLSGSSYMTSVASGCVLYYDTRVQ